MPSTEQAERFGTILTARSSLAAARYRAYLDAEIPVWDGLPSPADRATQLALRRARIAAGHGAGTFDVPRVFTTATWRDPHANGARGYRDTVVNWEEMYRHAQEDISEVYAPEEQAEPEPEMVSPYPDPLASGASFTTPHGSYSAVAYRQYLRRQMRAYADAQQGTTEFDIWQALYNALTIVAVRHNEYITIPVCWQFVPPVSVQDAWHYSLAVQDYEYLLSIHQPNTTQESPLPVNTTIDPNGTFTVTQRPRSVRPPVSTSSENDVALERLLQEEATIEATANAIRTAIDTTPAPTPRNFRRTDVYFYVPGTIGMEEYVGKLREAVDFLRANSSGRYSDRTHGRFLRKAEAAQRALNNGATGFEPELELPGVAIIEEPFSYDEETEVKTGGIMAVALVVPNTETGKNTLYLAVKVPVRRRKAGTVLCDFTRHNYGTLTTYVNRNAGAPPMVFALNRGFVVNDYNAETGVIELVWY